MPKRREMRKVEAEQDNERGQTDRNRTVEENGRRRGRGTLRWNENINEILKG